MIKRLIFDVDNTIITGVDFNPAIEKLLKKHNIYSEKILNFLMKQQENMKKNIKHIHMNII